MAFHRLLAAASEGSTFSLYGGGQTRDFTYVKDAVIANLLAAEAADPAEVYNVGGGSRVDLEEAIRTIEEVTGKTISLERQDVQKGDVRDTWADVSRAEADLDYRPAVSLREGLESMARWYAGTGEAGS